MKFDIVLDETDGQLTFISLVMKLSEQSSFLFV